MCVCVKANQIERKRRLGFHILPTNKVPSSPDVSETQWTQDGGRQSERADKANPFGYGKQRYQANDCESSSRLLAAARESLISARIGYTQTYFKLSSRDR